MSENDLVLRRYTIGPMGNAACAASHEWSAATEDGWRSCLRCHLREFNSEDVRPIAATAPGDAAAERAAVVAWLRRQDEKNPTDTWGGLIIAADAIERGEHVRGGT